MSIASPIHDAGTETGRLRFHRPPHDEPDFAWLVLDDLLAALHLTQPVKEDLLRSIQADWPGRLRTLATRDGVQTILPHYMVQGLLDAWVEAGLASEELLEAYLREGFRASKILTAGFSARDRMAYMFAALARDDGHEA